jgi:hypothetical protein
MAASVVTAVVSLLIAAIGAFTLDPFALWASRVWSERLFSAGRGKGPDVGSEAAAEARE